MCQGFAIGTVLTLSHLHLVFRLWKATQPHLRTTQQTLRDSPSQPTQRWSRPLAPGPSPAWASWPCGLMIVVPDWEQKTGPHGPTGLDSWEELYVPTHHYQLT